MSYLVMEFVDRDFQIVGSRGEAQNLANYYQERMQKYADYKNEWAYGSRIIIAEIVENREADDIDNTGQFEMVIKENEGGVGMFNIAEEVIEVVGNAPTPKKVENILNSMSDRQCLEHLEKIINEAAAMNYCYGSEFQMLQAALMYAEKVIENNMKEEFEHYTMQKQHDIDIDAFSKEIQKNKKGRNR